MSFFKIKIIQKNDDKANSDSDDENEIIKTLMLKIIEHHRKAIDIIIRQNATMITIFFKESIKNLE